MKTTDKTAAIVGYLPFIPIGIILGIVLYNSNKTKFTAYHLRQAIGINVLAFAFWVIMMMINSGNPMRIYSNYTFMMIVMFLFLILLIVGMVNASSGQEKPIPVAGLYFEKWFSSLFTDNAEAITTTSETNNEAASSKPVSIPDLQNLTKNKSLIFAVIALISCFFPWVKMEVFMASTGFSALSLSTPFALADTILVPALIYLLPISLAGIIAADFIPQLKQYKKILMIASVALVIYAGVGLYQFMNPSDADTPLSFNNAELSSLTRRAYNTVSKNIYSVGIGYYITLIATLGNVFFSRK
ncbi:MAG: hypothetical protein J0G96_07805 [Flavobacteriia bacterium]|nr:hypothetical protein [Flavobacteriia bacterium]OJX39390.1 MAG: hypothetical protein BGO87_05295 [Flavobacteriia bacterium 40-80]